MIQNTSTPILADERERYRKGLRQAIAGVESARLALAWQRMEIARRVSDAPTSLALWPPQPPQLPA